MRNAYMIMQLKYDNTKDLATIIKGCFDKAILNVEEYKVKLSEMVILERATDKTRTYMPHIQFGENIDNVENVLDSLINELVLNDVYNGFVVDYYTKYDREVMRYIAYKNSTNIELVVKKTFKSPSDIIHYYDESKPKNVYPTKEFSEEIFTDFFYNESVMFGVSEETLRETVAKVLNGLGSDDSDSVDDYTMLHHNVVVFIDGSDKYPYAEEVLSYIVDEFMRNIDKASTPAENAQSGSQIYNLGEAGYVTSGMTSEPVAIVIMTFGKIGGKFPELDNETDKLIKKFPSKILRINRSVTKMLGKHMSKDSFVSEMIQKENENL